MNKKNNPFVIVLILNYNGKYLLEDCISSYLNNTYVNFKVVVIDNGSSDGSMSFVESNWKEVKVLRTEKNLAYSGGFNFGLDYAFNKKSADFVLITNNDVKADENLIDELVKVGTQDDKIGFVTGKVYYFDNPDILQTVGKHEDPIKWNGNHIGGREKDNGQYNNISERVFIDDIYTLVSNQVYFQVGDYDTEFKFQSEEYDWQARAKKFGFKFYYTPNAKLWHKESMTIGKESAFKAYYDARNPPIVILKYKEPHFFKTFFWNHLKKDVFKTSLIKLKQFKIKSFFAVWSGFMSFLFWGFKNNLFTLKHFF